MCWTSCGCRPRAILQVDLEEVTRQAFEAQARKLKEIADGKTEAELVQVLESRLGPGQASSVAA